MTGQQLKNSILQMAVQGKLVPQDPNDEPASVLLERIRKEKEQLIKEGKIKKEKNPSYIFRGTDNLPYEKVGKNEPVCIADEVPFEIPESWEWVRLSKIVYNRGQMAPANDFCYIDIGSIDNKHQKLSDAENIIAIDKAPSRARKIVDIGDILYSTVRPYLHNMCIVDRPFSHQPIASTGFAALTCHTGFYNEFLFYYLMSPDFDAYANDTDNAKGVAYPAINDNKLYQALIPVPPEAEQKKIVEKIKKVLPYVDTYRTSYSESESLNNAFPNRLKKSILQEAVQGKLVPQDPTDEPASVLLERIRAEKEQLIKAGKIKRDKHKSVIFRRDNSHYEKLDGIECCIDDEIPFDLPESWEWVRFFSVVDIATNLVRPEEYADYMHIAPDNIEKATGTLFECHTVQQDKVVSPNHLFYKGQIIYSKIRPLLRKAVIAPFDGLCSADMYPLNTAIKRKYLLRYMLSDAFNLQVATAMSSRVKMPKINQDELSKILIPIPPMQEQERIVSKIEELFDKITLI